MSLSWLPKETDRNLHTDFWGIRTTLSIELRLTNTFP